MLKQKKKIQSYFSPADKEKLNSWEKQFISSLYQWRSRWSNKQVKLLELIISKYKLVEKEIAIKITYEPYDDKAEKNNAQKITTRRFRRMLKIKKAKKLRT